MLIDRTQRTWAWISFLIFLAATGTYIVYANTAPTGPHGGSVMGLIYGIIGTAFMVFAGLLAARKRVPHWRLGSAQFWLRGHLWLGTLSMPLILYHAGFGWGGLLENILWILFGGVFLSGLFGLAVQQVLPRIITTRLPLETFKAQIPYQSQRMQFLADRLVSETCGKLDIEDEPMHATFKKLAAFGAAAKKDELSNWPDQAPAEYRGLLLDLSTHAKQQGWINKTDNFPKFLAEIYKDIAPEEAPKPPAAKAEGAGKKPSPLDQMKAKKKAAADGGEKKLSPLEQMKAKAAAKKKTADGGAAEPEKKLSPIEQMRAKAAAKKKGPAAETGEPEKKLSPIEQMRAKAAAKKKGPVAETGEPEKKLSPIEQMRAKAAAKKKTAEGGEGEPEKKLSPIEQMRAKAAAKKTAETAAGNGAKKLPLELSREQVGGSTAAAMSAAGIPEDSGQTINFSPEQAAILAAHAERMQPESFDAAAVGGPVIVPCPECEHELKLPDRSLLGRKARCPLCSFKFVLELPEEEPVAVGAGVAAEAGASSPPASKSPAGAKLSPLEKARQQAAKKSGAGGGAAEKPLSPIEKMRAAKKAVPGAAPAAKKSKKKKATLKVPKKTKKVYSGPIPRAAELRDFYERQIRPFLGAKSQYHPQLAVDAQSKRLFSRMRADLPGELHETLNQLEDYVDERRQYSVLARVHRWLHWWLFLHIPLSMGLYVLMVAHIIMSLIVDPELFWG